ncbi:hypothetical protein Aperf_G00000061611 [Anoplocephala perfoliata]
MSLTRKSTLQSPDKGESDQQQPQSGGVARLHPAIAKPSISASSTSVFRSLSAIHPSTAFLDVASTVGLPVIRPDTHPEAFVPVPPDGGWGWVVVFAAFFTNLIIDGICVSFAIMVADLVDHFHTTVATVMLMGSLLLGVYQIVGPVASGLVNHFGCRAVGFAGALLATVSVFISAFMPSIELMIIFYGIFAGAAFGFLHLPSIVCVSFYFDSRRAIAVGITMCGPPLGAIIFPPLTDILLSKFGWSNTLIFFAGILLQCAVFATLYRPLTPALVLTPMKKEEVKSIKSLLQLVANEEGDGSTPGQTPTGEGPPPHPSPGAIISHQSLRAQPVLEEVEEEEDEEKEKEESKPNADAEKTSSHKPLLTVTEGPEGGAVSTSQTSLQANQPRRRRIYHSERLTHGSYVRPHMTDPIPHQSTTHLAIASAPRTRSVSVAVDQVARSHLSTFGSALFSSAVDRFGSSGTGMNSPVELTDTGAPVIVELPHESITVEDYARPLYRKDIFFPGSVKRRIDSSAAQIAAAASNIPENLGDQIASSHVSLSSGVPDGVRYRKTSMGTAVFGSSINFGANVPLPPINEASVPEDGAPSDANWAGSCLMSLTKIPLPDVSKEVDKPKPESQKRLTMTEEEEDKIWDILKAQTNLNLTEKPADGIYRVPRSHSLCGWWLCWKTEKKHPESKDSDDEIEGFKRSLLGADKSKLKKSKPILVRRCAHLPKSIIDVLMTMMDLSLLKSFSFSMYCLASIIAVMGVYVPLFFVCDIADSFNIPKSQSAYLLTAYGAASVFSRLACSWAAGFPNVSSTLLCAVALLLSAAATCIIPYWGSLVGQMLLMIVFGAALSPFFSLTSIILCDILGLEALTNAYGIVVMVRGISSTIGSPIAGMIVAATSSYSAAFLIAGATIIIGALLYVVILFYERAKLRKLTSKEGENDLTGKV